MTIRRSGRAFGCGLLALTLTLAAQAHAVDGVIEINQARADKGGVTPGDTPGFPITLSASPLSSEPTSFRLTGSLFNSTTNNVIEIVSPHVTLDLNGFTITCMNPPCAGNAIQSTEVNVAVTNGTVRGFAFGVNLAGPGARVENVRAHNNTTGLSVGSNCLVRNNVVTASGVDGILVQSDCNVIGNIANNGSGDGICTHGASNVIGNTVTGNNGFGLNLSDNTGYSQNVVTGGPFPGGTVKKGVSAGLNVCNGNPTCP